MKTITFGPVTHPDESYAYALGYGAVHMGQKRHYNPYSKEEYPDKHADFNRGYDVAVKVSNEVLDKFIAENMA